MSRAALALALSLLVTLPAVAQRFEEQSLLLNERLSPIVRPVKGASIIDYNRDGLMDVYREGLLQTQRENGRFENLLGPSGISDLTGATEGGIWADYDADGFPDLYQIDAGQSSALFRNLGRWFFARTDRRLGLDNLPPVTSATWFEANGDGLPDLAVARAGGMRVYVSNLPDPFILRALSVGGSGCGLAAHDYDHDGDTDLYESSCIPGSNADVFHNNPGSGRTVPDPNVVSPTNLRLGIGAVWIDYDRDGDLDLFVANQFEEPPGDLTSAVDRLYRNDGQGRFTPDNNVGELGGAILAQAWGVAAADFDNDGWIDVIVTNRDVGEYGGPSVTLFRNNGDGTFSDVAGTALALGEIPDRAVPVTGDLNGDGWQDLYLAAGQGDRLFYGVPADNHWIRIRLRGLSNNEEFFHDGLGASIVVWTGGSPQAGRIATSSGHASQSDGLVAHFGLGAATRPDSVIVTWRAGRTDRFLGLPGDQEVVLEQGGRWAPSPGTFAMTAPDDGHQVELASGPVTFSWSPLDAQGSLTYELSIAGPGVDTTLVDITGTSVTVPTDFLAQQQTYFWTVVARTEFGVRSATERRTFVFGGSTVSAPIKLAVPFRPLRSGQVKWADFDGDGDLDLALTGTAGQAGDTRVYAAVDTLFPAGEVDLSFKIFREIDAILRKVSSSHVSWVDFDSDGDQDLFLAGYFRDVDGVISLVSEMYVNDREVLQQDQFVSQGFPDVQMGDGAWADFDGDGDDDLVLAGATSLGAPFTSTASLVINNLPGALGFTTVDAGFVGVRDAVVTAPDLDGDGAPDVVIAGVTDDNAPGVFAYRNNRDGTFTPMDLGLPARWFSSMDWGDYDGDGDPDLVVTGGELSPELFSGRTRVYRNDGGRLTDIGAERDLAQVVFGSARWLDFDLDGDLDLLVSGAENPFGTRLALIYRNEDNVRFAEEFRLSGQLFAFADTGDYNRDGDPDIVLIGELPDGQPGVQFFLNMARPETIPAALIQR